MSPFFKGFADEVIGLQKTSGIASGVAKLIGRTAGPVVGAAGKLALKHPMLTLFGVLPATTSAASEFGSRMTGKAQKLLPAEAGRPSAAFYTNFSPYVGVRKFPGEQKRMSWNVGKWRSKESLGTRPV